MLLYGHISILLRRKGEDHDFCILQIHLTHAHLCSSSFHTYVQLTSSYGIARLSSRATRPVHRGSRAMAQASSLCGGTGHDGVHTACGCYSWNKRLLWAAARSNVDLLETCTQFLDFDNIKYLPGLCYSLVPSKKVQGSYSHSIAICACCLHTDRFSASSAVLQQQCLCGSLITDQLCARYGIQKSNATHETCYCERCELDHDLEVKNAVGVPLKSFQH